MSFRLAAAVILLFAGSRVHAHALHAACKLRGDTVLVEAFYDDNTPGRDARVTVKDAQGTEIATGHTDDAGRWTFPRPEAGKYEVVVDTGDGHRSRPATLTIPTDTALATMQPTPDEIVVSGGPTRAEITRFPWLRLVLGVAAIAGLATLLWLASRRRRENDVRRPHGE